jgi:hypothetical protein
MSEPVDTLIKRSEYLFTKRKPLLSFWQEICENFYPIRAQFTRQFYLSEQFADRILTSYPLIVQRELGNTFSAMLRPRDQDWFDIRVDNYERLDKSGKAWLEWASGVQRRAMYDRMSQFVRATKEADHDFAALGQCAITRELDMKERTLLYRCWHLKDVVWNEGYNGSINEIYRNWAPCAQELIKLFPDKVDPNVKKWAEKEPYREVKCLHVVLPGEEYDQVKVQGTDKKSKSRTPWVSVYVDVENKTVLQETGSFSRIYTLPRWQTVSGSQYAYSPAAVAGLPDGRLLQAMTLTLMEAGEIAVRPPLVATKEAVRSDMAIYAGGVTWVDAEYDERLGEALRPLYTEKGGLQFGMEMLKDAREKLSEAFYLNKLSLPPPDREMTAYETGQRIQEWIRSALPLFEPMETEYNAAICDDTFDALMRAGAFGSHQDIPQSIRGRPVRFSFESPLHQATARKKGALFLQAGQLITEAAQLDPSCVAVVDAAEALRDALDGIGVPAEWTRDPDEVAQIQAQHQQQQAAALATQQVQNAANAGESLGRAAQALGGVSPGASA